MGRVVARVPWRAIRPRLNIEMVAEPPLREIPRHVEQEAVVEDVEVFFVASEQLTWRRGS